MSVVLNVVKDPTCLPNGPMCRLLFVPTAVSAVLVEQISFENEYHLYNRTPQCSLCLIHEFNQSRIFDLFCDMA